MIEKYRPLFIHLNPASIPEVVAHIQKYLTENEFVTVEDFGSQFQEYIDAHPDIIKVGSVNGLTGDVVLTSENITMTGESSDTIGTVIGDILEDASATGDTVDDLVVDMDTVKTDIATLENVFTGATEESSGVKGLVPAPANTQVSHYLRASGSFEAIPAREVLSNAVSEGGTVESALTTLKTGLDGLTDYILYTSPASVGENITIGRFICLYFPKLKIVYYEGRFSCSAFIPTNTVSLRLPAEVPGPIIESMHFDVFMTTGQQITYVQYHQGKSLITYGDIPSGTVAGFSNLYFCA